jgi:RNA ligase (TIGR02306 family)
MRKLASIQAVNAVESIANADAIERIRVLGWWVVVKKGEFKPGDRVVYCEIDSLLPERAEFEFLRPSSFKPAQTDGTGQIVLPAGFRIKTVKLRGQVSQGILDDMAISPVPQLGTIVLDHTVDSLIAFSEGASVLNPKVQREGVVLRPLVEEHDEEIGGRLSFKAINPKFLLKYDE